MTVLLILLQTLEIQDNKIQFFLDDVEKSIRKPHHTPHIVWLNCKYIAVFIVLQWRIKRREYGQKKKRMRAKTEMTTHEMRAKQ